MSDSTKDVTTPIAAATDNGATSPVDPLNTVPHQLGRLVTGSLAAYAADKAAGKVYNTIVLAIRARRSK